MTSKQVYFANVKLRKFCEVSGKYVWFLYVWPDLGRIHIWSTMRALPYFQHLLMVEKPLKIDSLEEQMWRAPWMWLPQAPNLLKLPLHHSAFLLPSGTLAWLSKSVYLFFWWHLKVSQLPRFSGSADMFIFILIGADQSGGRRERAKCLHLSW